MRAYPLSEEEWRTIQNLRAIHRDERAAMVRAIHTLASGAPVSESPTDTPHTATVVNLPIS